MATIASDRLLPHDPTARARPWGHDMAIDLCERATWDALAAESDPGFFGRSDWLEAVCPAAGMEPRYVVVTACGVPILRVGLAHRRRWGRELVLSPPTAPYAGWAERLPDGLTPIEEEDRRHEVLQQLVKWCARETDFTRIAIPPDAPDIRPLIWSGWEPELRYAYRIPAAAGARVSGDSRRHVGREAPDLVILRPEGRVAADMLAVTLAAAFERAETGPPLPAAAWRGYLDAVARLPAVRVLAAVDARGEPHGAIVLARDTRRAYELLAGTTEAGSESHVGALLMRAALDEIGDVLPEVEVVGANASGIALFRSGFSGAFVPYVAVSRAPLMRAEWAATGSPGLERRLGRAWLRMRRWA